MQWSKGVPRLLLSMLGALAVLGAFWGAGLAIYAAFANFGGWMGSAAIVSVVIFGIATAVFMEG